ncbi:hypothetical protein BT63DRAFT_460699 [Microthyrium microscopicum]|uniref:P-type domain-containing protein n=1 Tax=Microthyrium microscopicum TaxID=703497 RepID=A0A6A6TX59_9PEZI|nr:hypothetical protein BT63DRAFT_460699 [Microthyrium microscopicum]
MQPSVFFLVITTVFTAHTYANPFPAAFAAGDAVETIAQRTDPVNPISVVTEYCNPNAEPMCCPGYWCYRVPQSTAKVGYCLLGNEPTVEDVVHKDVIQNDVVDNGAVKRDVIKTPMLTDKPARYTFATLRRFPTLAALAAFAIIAELAVQQWDAAMVCVEMLRIIHRPTTDRGLTTSCALESLWRSHA